jgi:hypothetical protein
LAGRHFFSVLPPALFPRPPDRLRLAILAFGLLTCCIGFVPLFLPYVGSVALLPVTFFFRGYAVCFLSRWRPDLVPDQVTGNK